MAILNIIPNSVKIMETNYKVVVEFEDLEVSYVLARKHFL